MSAAKIIGAHLKTTSRAHKSQGTISKTPVYYIIAIRGCSFVLLKFKCE